MTADVHSNWAHCKAFAIRDIKALIIAAAMLVLSMKKISDQPTHNLSPVAARSGNDQEKKTLLNETVWPNCRSICYRSALPK